MRTGSRCSRQVGRERHTSVNAKGLALVARASNWREKPFALGSVLLACNDNGTGSRPRVTSSVLCYMAALDLPNPPVDSDSLGRLWTE